jgi:hypothetical protein
MSLQPRSVLVWGLWLVTFGRLAAGLVMVRPLTMRVLAAGRR